MHAIKTLTLRFSASATLAALVLTGCATTTDAPAAPVAAPTPPEPAPSVETPPPPPPPAAPQTPVSAGFTPDDSLSICPRMTVSNAPSSDADGQVRDYSPFISVNSVMLSVSPVNAACLSSGFGPRNGRQHKGIDLQSKPAGMVHAPADGAIIEAGYRNDFGNYVVIDHGTGVYTRLAHLQNLNAGMASGAEVDFGTPLGLMGNTASYYIPIHLHYELLLGDYDNPKKSFGLTPKSFFDYPFVLDEPGEAGS